MDDDKSFIEDIFDGSRKHFETCPVWVLVLWIIAFVVAVFGIVVAD